MDKLYDMNNLYKAYKASLKSSAWKEEPQKFEINFLSELFKLKRELESGTYKTQHGSTFVQNERGKIRLIHGNRMRDRVIRHILCDEELTPKLEPFLIYNNTASQKGKGISFARKKFEQDLHNYWLKHKTNEGYIGFVDLSKFYDNMQHQKIKDSIKGKISDFAFELLEEILATFEIDVSYMSDKEFEQCLNTRFDSVEYHTTIPVKFRTGKKMMAKSVEIGDQVSQNIGVYFPTPLDNYIKIVRSCKCYGRYMDDMYIIGKSKQEVQSLIDDIYIQAKRLGLFVNPKKTRIVKLSSTYKFLQIRYSLTDSGRVIRRVNPKCITRERRKLKAYKRLLDNNEICYNDIENAYRSWLGTMYPYMSDIQIINIMKLFQDLFQEVPT